MTMNAAKMAPPTRLPSTTMARVSHRPRPRMMPRAPRIQFTGAMLAPAQIHICCGPVESLSASGIGSTLWASSFTTCVSVIAVDTVPDLLRGAATAPRFRRNISARTTVWEGAAIYHQLTDGRARRRPDGADDLGRGPRSRGRRPAGRAADGLD